MTTNQTRCPFVVGLGASAGGLEPLEQFFDALPLESGVAFVVVQHLSPDFKSMMKELLTRHTTMAVHRVEQDMLIEPNAIYLIPPQKDMRLEGGRLHLSDPSNKGTRSPNFSIDLFFESLAKDMGNRAIAIVLSGTGSDGSRGIRTINERGGLVVVQDPATAQFDGMPRSAIATGSVHTVLSPAEIARSVFDYIKRLDTDDPDGPMIAGVTDRAVIQEVVGLLRLEDGIDFSHYRPGTIARRVSRRISITGYSSVSEYVGHLAKERGERIALRNDLLIGVTRFFRDTPAWDLLYERVIRPLALRDTAEPIRVWVTACSTGEEVYSLAVMIREAMEETDRIREVKIFATDIDKRALETAALGSFPASISEDIAPHRLQKYFVQESGGYRVTRSLREMVIFAEHNLTRDAAFTNMDIVSCRNVLIYMESLLQQRVISMLHFALRVEGTLFLGAAETLGNVDAEFSTIDSKWNVFRKKRDITLDRSNMRRTMAFVSPVVARSGRRSGVLTQTETSVPKAPDRNIFEEALSQVLHDKKGACMILDSQHNLLHATGSIQSYLRVPEGAGTTKLGSMVAKPLTLPLEAALQRARTTLEPVRYTGITLDDNGNELVDITVTPIGQKHQDGKKELDSLMVIIEDGKSQSPSRPASPFTVDDHVASRIADLEHELQQTRESLQATIEELETTNEENQATNEELLASNEELQSTNEELQSVNEELYTVNAEHQIKIQELTDLNNDIDNLLLSTQHGTLFLDRSMRIRKFTPAVLDVVQLTEQDIGRPISDFSNKSNEPNLWRQFRAASESEEIFEARLRTISGREVYLRCVPYQTDSETSAGVVATFFDVEQMYRAIALPPTEAMPDAKASEQEPAEGEASSEG